MPFENILKDCNYIRKIEDKAFSLTKKIKEYCLKKSGRVERKNARTGCIEENTKCLV